LFHVGVRLGLVGLSACLDGTNPDSADSSSHADTGLLQAYYVASFVTEDGSYADASFGIDYKGVASEASECEMRGQLPYEGTGPDDCPGCEWTFDLGGITLSEATGDRCSELGLFDGAFDGSFDYAWGFADVYYYDYEGLPLPLENTVFLYLGAWFPFAFNYGPSDWVTGDETNIEIVRPMFTSAGDYVYYYYYP
jgi:hypothetical protein